ncbi:site-specific integrase [Limnohabitans sp. DM1]|uniref:tyrosine-type recombinase/integrase n=1 Tax=Limnohabitans sp. DM1 TaxID=1597955 RepID=UPI000ADBE415|nr:site-specific integrase [Limnohabitans sp. DM1]
MAKITTKALEALKHSDHGKRLADGDRMFGIVRAVKNDPEAVSVDFEWRYNFGGKVRQVRIGTWPRMTLKALRDERDALKGKLKDGIDPLAEKEADRLKQQADQIEAKQTQITRLQELAAKDARMTVRGLFELWQSTDLKKRQDGGSEALRAFEADVFPLIGDVAAADVTKAHIQRIIDTMLARGVKRMTERVFSDLRQLFGFALDRDHIEADPTARIKKHKIGGSVERDRVLSEAELIEFFNRLPESGLVASSQCALTIQLATITRIGEVLGARWEHVDFERRIWTLPETKNGKRHTVNLNDLALKQFEALRQHTGLTEWVFPASRLNGPVCPKTVTKQVADRQRGDDDPMSGRSKQTDSLALSGGQWRPHDLRRTGATLMAELGVLPDVIERCLNHTEQTKVKRIYQRAQYEAPMREAWKRLGDRLILLTNKLDNVVVLLNP